MFDAMKGRLPLSKGATSGNVATAIDPFTPNTHYFLRQQSEGVTVTTLARYGATGAPATSGSASNVNDSTGSYINYNAAASGAIAGWTNQSICIIPTSFPIRFTCVTKTGATSDSISSVRIQVGFGNVIVATLDEQTVDAAYFRYSTAAGDTKWQACTCDGTTQGESDTGVVVAANTRYVFQIRIVSTSTYEFYINGSLVATRTTNVPTSTQAMQLVAQLRNATAPPTRGFRIRLWTVESL